MSRRPRLLPLLLLAAVLSGGCSVKKLAVNTLGSALAKGGDVYASDDDLELVGAAVPFGLKTIEALIVESPANADLLQAAASGFTQYSYAFVASEADYVEGKDLARATELRSRAKKLYLRARGYGLRGLEARHPGLTLKLRKDPAAALAVATRADVPLLYWTAAPWAAATSLSKEDPELTADQGLFEALMRRALALDETFGHGSVHDFFISWEGGRPAAAGGSPDRARTHLKQAMTLSDGRRAAPLVSFAESVCVGRQDRKEFTELLQQALAIDPSHYRELTLANTVSQKRARWLLSRADELFVE